MSRPAMTIGNTTGHRTNAEKEQREAAEKALLTGIAVRERPEVAANEAAHIEFLRVCELLSRADRNDALIETVINRYCSVLAECIDFERKREKVYSTAEKLEEKLDALDSDATYEETKDAAKAIAAIYASAIACDKQVQSKRKMLFDIEKENGLTLAAALRSIPKRVETKTPLAEALRDDD